MRTRFKWEPPVYKGTMTSTGWQHHMMIVDRLRRYTVWPR